MGRRSLVAVFAVLTLAVVCAPALSADVDDAARKKLDAKADKVVEALKLTEADKTAKV